MLNLQDIKKITEAQIEAQKELFYTKPEMDQKFSNLQASVDGIAKGIATNNQEVKQLNHRMKNAEDWIGKAAPKVGAEFEH